MNNSKHIFLRMCYLRPLVYEKEQPGEESKVREVCRLASSCFTKGEEILAALYNNKTTFKDI